MNWFTPIEWEAEQKEVARILSNVEALKLSIRNEKKNLTSETEQLDHARTAQELLQQVAQAVQQKAHERISHVVSSCLSAVFDEPYTFKIEFERKRGKTEARLLFTREGLEVDPLTASGGGCVDLASFALRLACLVLHRPRLRQVLFLDEPFKNVSKGYRDNVRAMLEQVCREMKVQVIMVSHDEVYEAGKIIEL